MNGRTARRLAAWSLFAVFVLGMSSSFTIGALNHTPLLQGATSQWFAFTGIAAVGLVVSLRRPANPLGWILAVVGAWLGMLAFAEEYSRYTVVNHPGVLVGGLYVAWFYQWAWFPMLVSLLVLPLLLFPDGRLPSQRWRPVLWTAIGLAGLGWIPLSLVSRLENTQVRNPFGLPGAEPLVQGSFGVVFALVPIVVLLSFTSLVVRFRRADSAERQQIKWFMFAAGVIAACTAVGIALNGLGIRAAPSIADLVFGLVLALLPVSVGIAILKYRLYDIDVVINKTVVYAALAAFITAVYVGIVVGIGAAIGQGDKPNLGLSILATAVVAVAFQPVRERVQRFANRLVYGKRATPYEVLAHFSDRMASTYAADELLPQMARILAEGTTAARAEVWLKVGKELRREGAWPSEEAPTTARVELTGDDLPGLVRGDLAVPVRDRGELLGALAITKARGEPVNEGDRRLLKDLASQAGLVLRNVKLIEELRASRQRIVSAQDEERRRLERNIHDGAQQQLVALNVKLGLAKTLAAKDPDKTEQLLAQLQHETQDALDNLRDLARGIYPPLLRDQGLAAALDAQARRAPIPVHIEADGIGRYAPDAEAAAYFSVLEALQNVSKYARASRAVIRLSDDNSSITFEVEDDGSGFDPTRTSYGTGLQGMADRVEALGGRLDVRSDRGAGTTIMGRLPVRRLERVE